jgi:hypothetical protein
MHWAARQLQFGSAQRAAAAAAVADEDECSGACRDGSVSILSSENTNWYCTSISCSIEINIKYWLGVSAAPREEKIRVMIYHHGAFRVSFSLRVLDGLTD